ncbi:NAD(P)-dependent oxidoreductase [Gulosibacter sp. 10]|uniref:NAD(P)-dependent oxidoreductase n=1 Tax=Gulosibacter sp. 10 TaxID=1255570 RepID=UPI00097EAAA7|nr:NAD(P)-dependent oxidoreductase [Gulosibacter sp. 10]SJM64109.1 3-hydroxyisobutyrate dehydrogenase [Gulosibacter sp. 10]
MFTLTCIGVGNMGGAVARRLVTGEFDVTVYDPDEAAMDRCVESGATKASSFEEAVRSGDVVLTSLPTTALVLDTVEKIAAELPEGRTVVDISTIDPGTARRAATICEEHGLDFVACALGKTPAHAEQGAIPLFVGGAPDVLDALEPLFERMGEKTYRFDDVEGATAFKLVSNQIGMTNVVTLAEGLAVARGAGISPELFTEALKDTGAVSFQSEVRLPWMLEHDWSSRFGVDLAAKDVGLALDTARAQGLDTPVSTAALEQLRKSSAQGSGREDVVAVAKLYAEGSEG